MTFKRTKCELSESQISWHADEIAIEAAWERTGLKPTWPDDEAGCGVKYATAMADEIARLRLTDEERDCVRAAIRLLEHSTNSAADRAREGLLSIYRRFAEV